MAEREPVSPFGEAALENSGTVHRGEQIVRNDDSVTLMAPRRAPTEVDSSIALRQG